MRDTEDEGLIKYKELLHKVKPPEKLDSMQDIALAAVVIQRSWRKFADSKLLDIISEEELLSEKEEAKVPKDKKAKNAKEK